MIRLALRVARERAEPVLAELLELAPGGLEECDAGPEAVEYVLYGAPGELPALPQLRAVARDALVDVSSSEVSDTWEDRWRGFHVPVEVRSLRVRPPWEPPREGLLDVVIDPGQAFGTGAHPSTRLTLGLVAELTPAGALADWGCGSGILAVAAAKLGWAPVLACDIEAASVAATRAAAAANGVAVDVTRCDLRREPGPWAPTVLANLIRPLLVQVADAIERPPERLIASGLLPHEVDEVVAAFARHRLREVRRREAEGWAAVELALGNAHRAGADGGAAVEVAT